jgi:endonuclease III
MCAGGEERMTATSDINGAPAALFDVYLTAKEAVVARGFAWEIDWQAERRLDRIDESEFLRESAWTVLSAGFRETVVRRLFVPICDAFLGLRSAAVIQANRVGCRRAALKVFNNHRKVDAILDIASVVADSGFEVIRRRIQEEDVRFLQTLPYIGSITAFHLAKNLGLPVIKPDRHLQRIAKAAGFSSPREMCELISHRVGEPVQVVDVVLWRYATLFSDYVAVFAAVPRRCDPGRSAR